MRKTFHQLTLCAITLLIPHCAQAESLLWFDGQHPVSYYVDGKSDPVVGMALQMFASDMNAATGTPAVSRNKNTATLQITELDKASKSALRSLQRQGVPTEKLQKSQDGFHISVTGRHINIVGANGRGTAYGILELSRMAGVSPWIWWGDCVPQRKDRLAIDTSFSTTQSASVEYRGIFINDEDWSLRPWSCQTFDKGAQGTISAATYKKICQLLLRLRGNTLWPAMHPGTKAFFQTPGAKAVADSCGIVIGSSHCEPLLRNNVGEWNVKQRGAFNYMTNRAAVQEYWAERLREVKNSTGGNLFTIGMRGIHDGSMEGVKTMDEKFMALQQVIDDQQQLIKQYIGDPAKQTQVFVPYKEVLQIYERGLKVPDYVTLMWCDDNYGYLTRLSTADEQKREGGAGVYYHLSYWGRPHDYLWLTTTQPGLIASEMKTAYEHNARKLWIANVHDPKVAGYDLELFLDMAWNINSVSTDHVGDHYRTWLCRQFGEEVGSRIYPAMRRFYQLCGERKPEFMGWSQVELDKKKYARGLSPMQNTAFNEQAFGNELNRYLETYDDITRTVSSAIRFLRPELKDAYCAAILYPVRGAAAMARKTLYRQKALAYAVSNLATKDSTAVLRDSTLRALCARSLEGYRDIAELTRHYNQHLSNGKWNGLMSMSPRDLPVFGKPTLPIDIDKLYITRLCAYDKAEARHPLHVDDAIARNACDWQEASTTATPVDMLGHSMRAVNLPQGDSLVYHFNSLQADSALLRIALIPTQPNDNGDLRFSVSIDGNSPKVFNLKEPFRSEPWKEQVLRGQAVKALGLKDLTAGQHTLIIKALDPHILVDQWMIDFNPGRKFYLFPIE